MQCVRSSQEAAGEVHALPEGAKARRPEPGKQAGTGSQPPSPTTMELRTWSSRIELSLRLLLFWTLFPPEVPGKEGKRGTHWSLCLEGWTWAVRQRGTSLGGREEGLAHMPQGHHRLPRGSWRVNGGVWGAQVGLGE